MNRSSCFGFIPHPSALIPFAGLYSSVLRLNSLLRRMAMIVPLFAQAGELEQGRSVADRDIDKVFAEWVEPAPSGS